MSVPPDESRANHFKSKFVEIFAGVSRDAGQKDAVSLLRQAREVREACRIPSTCAPAHAVIAFVVHNLHTNVACFPGGFLRATGDRVFPRLRSFLINMNELGAAILGGVVANFSLGAVLVFARLAAEASSTLLALSGLVVVERFGTDRAGGQEHGGGGFSDLGAVLTKCGREFGHITNASRGILLKARFGGLVGST